MKHYGMMALMAIMILCSAATCTVSGDDDDRLDNEQRLVGTSWKAVYFSDGNEWVDPEDYGCDFTITFNEYDYNASFTEPVYDEQVTTHSLIYQGKYSVQYNSIYCYNGNSSNESIHIDISRTGNGQMEATVNLISIGERYKVRMIRK